MPPRKKTDPDQKVDRMGLALPGDLAELVRVEAARRRESLAQVVTRRLRESYAKSPKRESANAL